MDERVEEIVRRSRSNLAFALLCLPKDRRRDMQVFYAFCRLADDVADDPALPVEEKHRRLERWRAVVTGSAAAQSPVEQEVAALMQKHRVPAEEMLGIIDGVATDLHKARFATWEELRAYCHGVASCVGLVSIRIFGCTQPESKAYAENLGYALQLTNIIRDAGQDFADSGRIYLPQDEMQRFGVTEKDFAPGATSPPMHALLRHQAGRAREHFKSALSSLTSADRPHLRAAEAMRRIYSTVLAKIEADGFRVFAKRYRVSTLRKAWLLLRSLIAR